MTRFLAAVLLAFAACGAAAQSDYPSRAVFGGKVTLHFEKKPYLLLPIIPER